MYESRWFVSVMCVSVINWQLIQGIFASHDAGTSATSSWGNQWWHLDTNQHNNNDDDDKRKTRNQWWRSSFSAFSCSSKSTLCSNSVQPIIFRPVISACWDSVTPPVFQGYAFFFLVLPLTDLRQINWNGSFCFSQDFVTLRTPTVVPQRFLRPLRLRH